MKTTIVGRKCTPKESFKDHAEKKLAKIDKFFGGEGTAKITASVNKNNTTTVELTVQEGGLVFRSQANDRDMSAALDKCVDNMIRQIRKNKTRLARRLRQDAFTRSVEATSFAAEEPEESLEIVKMKKFHLKPMTRDEAVLQMNLLKHDFFAFRDEDNGGTFAVVYRRNDGGYGLIDDAP